MSSNAVPDPTTAERHTARDRAAVRRATLRAEAERLRTAVDDRERELAATREWATFLERECRTYRERAADLERRTTRLEAALAEHRDGTEDGTDADGGVLDRLRRVLAAER